MDYEYLIVGQGLAGSLLSYFLIKKGYKALVIDPGGTNASKVAGGMFNPITGRRMNKSWKAETLLPFAENTYRDMEKLLSGSFFHPLPMLRLFPSREEKNASLQRLKESDGYSFIDRCIDEVNIPYIKNVGHGGCYIKGTGYLDTKTFLDSWRAYLKSNDFLAEESLDYHEIMLKEDEVSWRDIKAGKLIFCEGYRSQDNPWFRYLPWNPAKGEILTISAPELKIEEIVNRNMYLIPLGGGLFRLGATYSWEKLDEETTPEARQDLLSRFGQLFDVPYTVVDQEAGVRPAVHQRRPFLGLHPEHPALGIFNGLGTKGVALAPYFAHQMANFLAEGQPLIPEVDISRFES